MLLCSLSVKCMIHLRCSQLGSLLISLSERSRVTLIIHVTAGFALAIVLDFCKKCRGLKTYLLVCCKNRKAPTEISRVKHDQTVRSLYHLISINSAFLTFHDGRLIGVPHK